MVEVSPNKSNYYRYSGVFCNVAGPAFPEIWKDRSASIFSVKQSMKTFFLVSENEVIILV